MIFGINTTCDISKLSQISLAQQLVKLRITILKYHSWYLCQISLQIMLLPIHIYGEFARHEFRIFWLETLPDSLSLSLTGIRLSPKQARRVNNGWLITSRTLDDYRNSPTIKFCADLMALGADLFPAHRSCPSAIKFKIRLECPSVNWSNVLLISKAYIPTNKMNWM